MMPVIRISDHVFERLQSIAKPFVDTPGDVIERLLEFYESVNAKRNPSRAPSTPVGIEATPTQFDPYDPPDLTHTRVLSAELDGERATGWNDLVELAHRRVMARVDGDFSTLRSMTLSNIAAGRKSDSGFHYDQEINVSIQYVPSNKAWQNAFHLAKRYDFRISVDFEWQQKKKAANPGKRGRLEWDSTQTHSRNKKQA